jgi:hypothetical protein
MFFASWQHEAVGLLLPNSDPFAIKVFAFILSPLENLSVSFLCHGTPSSTIMEYVTLLVVPEQ